MAKEVKEKKTKAKKEEKQAEPQETSRKGPPPRLKEKYHAEILPALLKRGDDYKNTMAVPRLQKIVVNMGVGEASRNIKSLDYAVDEIGKITGQKAVIRRARKAISSF